MELWPYESAGGSKFFMKVSLTLELCSLGMGGRPFVSLGSGRVQGGTVNCKAIVSDQQRQQQ